MTGEVEAQGQLTGTISLNTDKIHLAKLQEKTVIPTEEDQVITPDEGFDGFASFTVGKIPSNYGRITFNGLFLLVE